MKSTDTKAILVVLISIAIIIILVYINKKPAALDKKIEGANKAEQSIPQQTDPPIKEQNPYSKKYAGSYSIKVKGVNSGEDEKFILKENGECIWSYNGHSKSGHWKSESGIIKTAVRGNSGDLPEDFKLSNGTFHSTDDYRRYLSKD